MNITYSAYDNDKLIEKLNEDKTINSDLLSFFKNFSFNNVVNQNLAKGNSAYVFKNAIKEDTTKSKITLSLNKLHTQNLSKIVSSIREIVFQNHDELNELVSQCILKIKKDNEQIRPVIASLCHELQSTYFLTADGEKIYFRRLLLTAVKNDYVESLNYDDDTWSKDKSERSMILVGTLYNINIIEKKIMVSIINDLKKLIEYKEDQTQEYYEHVEKAIQQLSCLISVILPQNSQITNSEILNEIFLDIVEFIEKYIIIYEEKKCISKKIRIICKNSISEIRNYMNK
jgi:hypothetical protein